MTVEHVGDRLVLSTGGQRRTLALPSYLSYYRLAGYRVKDGWLRARFEPLGIHEGRAPVQP